MNFKNPFDPDNSKIKEALKNWLTESLKLEEDAQFEINEYKCSEPSCVHTETVITITNTEGVRHFKIAKPLTFIRNWDTQNMQKIASNHPKHIH